MEVLRNELEGKRPSIQNPYRCENVLAAMNACEIESVIRTIVQRGPGENVLTDKALAACNILQLTTQWIATDSLGLRHLRYPGAISLCTFQYGGWQCATRGPPSHEASRGPPSMWQIGPSQMASVVARASRLPRGGCPVSADCGY